MKKYVTILTLLLMPVLAFSAAAQQLTPQVTPIVADGGNDIVNETSNSWFVEFASPPLADGGKAVALEREKAAFRSAAKKAGLEYSERYAFDTLFNGLSITINPNDLGKLNRISGVSGLYPVIAMALPDTQASNPDLFTAIEMTGADIVQNDLGYDGSGVRVAVMDTGIDYDHPDLGSCFGEGCRVEFGYDFVGDAYTGPGSPINPDDDPDDCQGHGTHVAGIVGASGTVTGVAPGVTFGAYRVFGCNGSTSSDIMIAAMEMALADGMQVLNMSIGSAFWAWPQYPTAAAATRLVNKGVTVAASIGNSGTSGTFAAGAPGVGEKVIGVASVDNSHFQAPYFEVDGVKIGYNGMSFALPAPTSGTEEIVYVGQGCTADLPYLADPAGKVALISRGACSFNEKATNALAAGATAAVIHNNQPGNFNGTLGTPVAIAAVSITLEDGLFIQGLEPVDMTWTDQTDSFPNPTGGYISGFSSYGLAADLSLKPDISAPGGSIYSTYVMEKADYATLGGTSMASPHVAGAAALFLQAHPGTPSQAVRRILQNSADPLEWNLCPGCGYGESIHRQGAGLLDIDDSILATTHVEPGKISLGESESHPVVHTLTIENNGPIGVTYDLYDAWWSVDTTGTWASDLGYWLADQYLDFSTPSVFVPAGDMATVDVTFYPPTGAYSPDLTTYGGFIVLTPQGGGQEFSVPYAGIQGDYQELTILYANPFGLPFVANPAPSYSMEGGDWPVYWVNFGHQARKFRMTVYDANTDKDWHRAYDLDYFGRNANFNNIHSFPFDGYTVNGKKVNEVPDGDYYVVIEVQKPLGEDNNPDHWESWTSPVFTIARP
jgi:subtilisin family serine protease